MKPTMGNTVIRQAVNALIPYKTHSFEILSKFPKMFRNTMMKFTFNA